MENWGLQCGKLRLEVWKIEAGSVENWGLKCGKLRLEVWKKRRLKCGKGVPDDRLIYDVHKEMVHKE